MKTDDSIRYLASAYGTDMTKERVGVYLHALADLDPNLVAQAAHEIVKSNRWFPTVADLRGKVAEIEVSSAPALPLAPNPRALLDGVEHEYRDGTWQEITDG